MDLKPYREFMKSEFGNLPLGSSDQSKGKPQPPLQLPYDPQAKRMALPKPDPVVIKKSAVYACMHNRRSHRQWTRENITLDELAFLLWATQGVQSVLGAGSSTLRPVASGGARHPFETYLVANRIEGLDPAIYRYLPLSHEMVLWLEAENIKEQLLNAVLGQRFVVESAVTFIWSCVPYRGEWRYTKAAHKTMLLDAGHVCQNLYLACEALGLGTCAVGAYDQKPIDDLLRLDGNNEFVVYMAPVGKIKE